MEKSSIEILRHKFASDLEEILQCPVCCETLSSVVPSCIQGHHVCLKCQEQMNICPYCKGDFNGTRNYLAESLLIKFEEIRSSLLKPKQSKKRVNMVCMQTQTEFSILNNEINDYKLLIQTDVNQNIKKNIINPNVTPSAGKGTFPCKFRECNLELAHGRMLPHFRFYHNNNLIEEKLANFGKYTLEWEHSSTTEEYERVISIPNMGLFYLNISINETGNLSGNVQIINNASVAKQFHYLLALGNENTSMNYSGQVLSCRSSDQKIKSKSLFINSSCMSQFKGDKKTLKCTLSIQRILVDDSNKNKK